MPAPPAEEAAQLDAMKRHAEAMAARAAAEAGKEGAGEQAPLWASVGLPASVGTP